MKRDSHHTFESIIKIQSAASLRELPFATRFWAKVDIRNDDECWPWLGRVHGLASCHKNYGRVRVKTPSIKWEMAHRIAYVLSKGSIPAGLSVLHKCDNPICCNPSHLFTGSHAKNMEDMTLKKRYAVLAGEQNGAHKLKTEEVERIRKEVGLSISDLSRKYVISRRQVRRILTGQSWRPTILTEVL